MQTYKEYIQFFYDNGFDLQPLIALSKVPTRSGWTTEPPLKDKIFDIYKNEDNIEDISHRRNLGFRPGRTSTFMKDGTTYNIVVLDIDIKSIEKDDAGIDRKKLFRNDESEIEKHKILAAKAYGFAEKYSINANTLTGSGGYHCYIFIETSIFDKLKLKANQTLFKTHGIEIELLASGKNVVLPPSIHPETQKKYILKNLNFNFIDNINNDFIQLIWPKETYVDSNKIKEINYESTKYINNEIEPIIIDLANNPDANGYEFELNCIGYCLENNLKDKIHHYFKIFFGLEYDEKRTETLINKAINKENIRRSGSFIKMLKDLGIYEKYKNYFIKHTEKNNDNELEEELETLNAKNFDYNLDSQQEWIIDYLIAKNEIIILAALGSAGKTTFAIQVALHALFNKNFNKEIVIKNKINNFLVITGEANFKQVNQNIKELLKEFNNPDVNPEQIKIIASDYALFSTTEYGKAVKSKYFKKLKEEIKNINPDLVIIDSMMSTTEINFNDSTQIQTNYRIAKKALGGRTALLLHHFNKGGYSDKKTSVDEIFGSVNIINKIRHVLTIKKENKQQKLYISKTNLGPRYKDVNFDLTALMSDDLKYLKGFRISEPKREVEYLISNKTENKINNVEEEKEKEENTEEEYL
jgi:hypothetical protein